MRDKFLYKTLNFWKDISMKKVRNNYMKSTGVVRRVDDLGRIVIPKEIRRTLRIREGEALEIFVDNEDIILKKYSPMESIEDAAARYVDSFNQVIKHSVIVTDKDRVIAASGSLKKRYLGKQITEFTGSRKRMPQIILIHPNGIIAIISALYPHSDIVKHAFANRRRT
jgi:AbrB family transcriptional regulator (stage V sporulation protein T)